MRKLKVLLVTVLFVFAISAVSYAADETAPADPPDRPVVTDNPSLSDRPNPTHKEGVKHKAKSKKKKTVKHNAAPTQGAAKY